MSDATLASTAQRLIAKRGRPMQVVRKRPATVGDASRPWEGGSSTESTASVQAVVLPLSRSMGERWADGTLVQQSDRMAYVAGQSVDDIRPGDVIVDGARQYLIAQATEYAPGSLSILWELGVHT